MDSTMQYRRLGSTDLEISKLGFGCAPVGSRASMLQSKRALRLAYDSGINYFDTADMYGVGGSEEMLGRVFHGRRDKVIISTKCGYQFSTRLKSLRWIKPLVRPLVARLKGVKSSASRFVASQKSQNFEPSHIQRSVHDSLRRLGVDYIDLYLLHDPPLAIAERADVFSTLQALKQTGKIRYFGVSCDLQVALRLLEMREDCGISAFQITINLLEQDAIEKLVPLLREQSLGLIVRQPFAHGALFHSQDVMSMLQKKGLPASPEYLASLALRFVLQLPDAASV